MVKYVNLKTNQTSEQLAYLAGIIDGEGCFYIGHVKQGKYGSGYQWHVSLQITNCDKVLIDWLHDFFGGNPEHQKRWTSKKAFERTIYKWYAAGPMLDYILPLVQPYLVIKKKHCEVMMRYRKTCKDGANRLSEETIQQRISIMKEMRQLNSRYHNHALKNPSAVSP